MSKRRQITQRELDKRRFESSVKKQNSYSDGNFAVKEELDRRCWTTSNLFWFLDLFLGSK